MAQRVKYSSMDITVLFLILHLLMLNQKNNFQKTIQNAQYNDNINIEFS
jgi:hypothetical protein